MTGKHFRAGVGTVIYNQNHEVVLWRRSVPPIGTWQFQQGGIDAGESIEDTLWRELKEETGLEQSDFIKVTEYPEWTLQVYPEEILTQPDQPNPDRLGQAHRWYFLELTPDTIIDLARATDHEFDDFRWTSWDEALTTPPPYKVHIYRALHQYYLADLTNN
jgi:putative (di)nucleoside polyphosphate hydrolase